MKSKLSLTLTILFFTFIFSRSAEAVLFDAAEVIEPGKFTGGVLAELLLSNPTSDGAELRVKYGVTKTLNTEGIVGIGTNSRKFRVGAQNVLSIYPDADGQIGVAALLNGLYLRRESRGVFVGAAGPMVHKKFKETAIPLNTFLALPLSIELDSGRYFTGSQIVAGTIGEFAKFYGVVELGLGIGKPESYVSAGVGMPF